jgi:hypothetical protein
VHYPTNSKQGDHKVSETSQAIAQAFMISLFRHDAKNSGRYKREE